VSKVWSVRFREHDFDLLLRTTDGWIRQTRRREFVSPVIDLIDGIILKLDFEISDDFEIS